MIFNWGCLFIWRATTTFLLGVLSTHGSATPDVSYPSGSRTRYLRNGPVDHRNNHCARSRTEHDICWSMLRKTNFHSLKQLEPVSRIHIKLIVYKTFFKKIFFLLKRNSKNVQFTWLDILLLVLFMQGCIKNLIWIAVQFKNVCKLVTLD